ncbi:MULTISPECIES: hypothetical protein [Nostocales]|uniref:Uncharacterized protein n=3 Tax=Nostocales TaxID=1161 RepID=A0A0C1QTH5_9CYAN|nr:hypothetical protein [Tolypothrix bouteillei]KAF3889424.1 hypothetical protein DA73_0400031035 [Tolypothrix bouteillei VB521301]
MSGSPKFSEAEIAQWKQKILEAERQRRAAIEAQRRQEAEERERLRQLEESRCQTQIRVQRLLSDVNSQWTNIYVQEAVVLQYRCQNQLEAIARADSEIQLLAISEELIKIEQAMHLALQRKRRDEAEKQRQVDIERQQFELEELERRVAQTPEAQALKFDAAGRQQLQQVFQNVRQAISAGDPAKVRRPLAEATALVQKHLRQIVQGQTDSRHLQTQTNRQLAELKITVTGLKADPVVMQWQAGAVAEIETQINAIQQAISHGQTKQVISQLTELSQRSQTIVETASTAQLQAEKRDYIADSISQTLQEMGFSITFHQPEHPNHPATSIILGATTNTGKAISVSVPIAGQVFYDVDGYVKHSVTAVDGNTSAVCDEAEQMLTEMHDVLEDKFGVRMGEVLWQGKNPNRNLRKAEKLPSEKRSRSRSI